MPTALENYIFTELPRRIVASSSVTTGASFSAGWVLVATGQGFQAIPTDPTTLGFEPTVPPPGADPTLKYYRGDKTWADLTPAAVGAVATAEKGVAFGVATLDADGFVELSQMNPSVIERVVVVSDEAARYALTIEDVQNGDVVNQQNPDPTMWYVYDDSNLDNSSGYLPFSSGVASSMAWSGLTGKPAIIGDLENISLSNNGDVLQKVAGHWAAVSVADLGVAISDVSGLSTALAGKQASSANLTSLSAVSSSGILVRTSSGNILTRQLVGVNGITVTQGAGEGDNPSVSLSTSGVTASIYGSEFDVPSVLVDTYGRITSATQVSTIHNSSTILDVGTDQALEIGHTYTFTGIYANTLSLVLPETPRAGAWVVIDAGYQYEDCPSSIVVSASGTDTIRGLASLNLHGLGVFPGTSFRMVYNAADSEWFVIKTMGNHASNLKIAAFNATNSTPGHILESQATDERTILIPDADVDLSKVGMTEFSDSDFAVTNVSLGKVRISATAVSPAATRILSMPDSNVNLADLYIYQLLTPDGSSLASPLKFGRVYRPSAVQTIAANTPIYLPATGSGGFGTPESRRIIIEIGKTISGSYARLTPQEGGVIVYANNTSSVNEGISTTNTYLEIPNFCRVTCVAIAPDTWFVGVEQGTGQLDTANFALLDRTTRSKRMFISTENIASGQSRTLTMPNADVDLVNSYRAASASANGYLTSTDWSTFNGKQAALADVITPGTYGSSTNIPVLTLNSKGIVTNVTTSAIAQAATVIVADGSSTITLAANTDYILIVTNGFTLAPEALSSGRSCFLINTTNLNRSITYTLPTKTMLYPHGSSFTTNILRAWSTAYIVQDSGTSTQMRFTRPSDIVASEFSLMTAGGSSSRIVVSLTGVSAQRTYSFADKDVNFGDMPSVATTNNNSLSAGGTRLQCIGGFSNTISGTDNVVIGSGSNTVSGTSNVIIGGGGSLSGNTVAGSKSILTNCTNCTTNATTSEVELRNCKYVDASNLIRVYIDNIEFFANTVTKNLLWADGTTVKGHKNGVTAECMLLTSITTNSATTLSISGTTNNKPVAYIPSNGIGDEEYAEHYVHLVIWDILTGTTVSNHVYRVLVRAATVVGFVEVSTELSSGSVTESVAFAVAGTGQSAKLNINVTISDPSPSYMAQACVKSVYF